MLKHIVEGRSQESMVEASMQAMNKAAAFLLENNDIRIAVLEMSSTRHAGYKVVLEVSLIPLGQREATDARGPNTADRRAALEKDRARREENADGWKRRIVENFRRRKGAFMATSAVHLAYMTEMMLMGQIENEFRAATQPAITKPALSVPDPSVIQPHYEPRVSDKIRAVPIADIVEHEFQHATHPEQARPAPVSSAKAPPAAKGPMPHEEPE